MTIEQLREIHRAQPFRPFVLRMADGTKVRVTHPERMMFLGSGRTVHVATGGESYKIVELLLIAAVHVADESGRNGRVPAALAMAAEDETRWC